MNNNILLNFQDANTTPLINRKVLFTPQNPPFITASYLSMGDSFSFLTDITGSISGSVVSGYYRVDIAQPTPATSFFLKVTETDATVFSGSTQTGSAQFVFFDSIIGNKTPFDTKKIVLTPAWNYVVNFSGSIITQQSTSSLTNEPNPFTGVTSSCFFPALVPGVYHVECFGKIDTSFYISVPYFQNSGRYGTEWDANELIVVKPAKGIIVRLNGVDNTYVLSVSSSDARYFHVGQGVSVFTASFAEATLTADFALVSAHTLFAPDSGSWASSSLSASLAQSSSTAVSSSYAATASFVLNAVSASYALSASFAPQQLQSSSVASASLAQNAISASYALTASFVNITHVTTADTASFLSSQHVTLADTSSFVTASNVQGKVSAAITASFAISASFAPHQLQSSSVATASFASASFTSTSASYAMSASAATSASYALSASYASSSSIANSASYSLSASYALSSSFALFANSASFASGSWMVNLNNDTISFATPVLFASSSVIGQNKVETNGTFTFNMSTQTMTVPKATTTASCATSASFATTASYAASGTAISASYANFALTSSNAVGTFTVTTSSNNGSGIQLKATGLGGIVGNLIINPAGFVFDQKVFGTDFQGGNFLGSASYALSAGNADNAQSSSQAISASLAQTAFDANTASYAIAASSSVIAFGLQSNTTVDRLEATNAVLVSPASIGGLTTQRALYLDIFEVIQASPMTLGDLQNASGNPYNVSQSFTSIISGSGAFSASYAATASRVLTASYASIAQTLIGGVQTASLATTASHLTGNADFPFVISDGTNSTSFSNGEIDLYSSNIISELMVTNGFNASAYVKAFSTGIGILGTNGNAIRLMNNTATVYWTGSNMGIGVAAPVNALDVSGNISCSVITASLFFGTGSYIKNADSASFITGSKVQGAVALASFASVAQIANTLAMPVGTASLALNAYTASVAVMANTASYSLSGHSTTSDFATFANLASSASYFNGNAASSSYALTASFFSGSVSNCISASYALSGSYVLTASFAMNGGSGGTTLHTGSTYPITASWAVNTITASFLINLELYRTSSLTALTSANNFTNVVGIFTTGSSYMGAYIKYGVLTGSNQRMGQVWTTWLTDGATIEYTEISTVSIGDTSTVGFSTDLSGSSVRLLATVIPGNVAPYTVNSEIEYI